MSPPLSARDLAFEHKKWLGPIQPEGLVVTAAVLADAEVFPPRSDDLLRMLDGLERIAPTKRLFSSFRALAEDLLEWPDDLAVWGDGVPSGLTCLVSGQTVSPSFAFRDPDTGAPLLLGLCTERGRDLDDGESKGASSDLSPTQTLEQLLWQTGVSIGLVENGRAVRLVYAPPAETVGHLTFPLEEMFSTAGRGIFLAPLVMLLHARRIAFAEPEKRLATLLAKSREYQNTVSAALQEQVLSALNELLRGVQLADARSGHTLLTRALRNERQKEVTGGLVTVILRLVFLFYAEEKGLLPLHDRLYAESYSLGALFTRLEADRVRHGDTLEERFGAWAHLLSLFRLLHGGVQAATGLSLPARRGDLFDPERYPFLEGREHAYQQGETLDLPKISDATVLRVLSYLAVHKGERLMYRGLDVEHIGGVYEGLMGFDLLLTVGESARLMPYHLVIDLSDLARKPGPERLRLLKVEAGLDVKDKSAAAVRDAASAQELFVALAKHISPRDPDLLPRGTLVLQPGEERRRTGSHYTPRALTRPIVEATLRPLWERMGPEVTPAQILDVKVCDPAMGSGAFLVEACRQIAQKLTDVWRRTGETPPIPPDENALLHARRLVAQTCLYGVDKNPLAVDLARVSLWLETFASDHPFTFVDHALRAGDSLVGLTREQIGDFSFRKAQGETASASVRKALEAPLRAAEKTRKKAVKAQAAQLLLVRQMLDKQVGLAQEKRRSLQQKGDVIDDRPLADLWREAEEALDPVRAVGDLLVSVLFGETQDKAREKARENWAFKVQAWLSREDVRDGDSSALGMDDPDIRGAVEDLGLGKHPVTPFHWEVELPEVFARERPGFDAILGNPPFAGKNNLASSHSAAYLDWLGFVHEESHGNADVVAHFFRRAFGLLRDGGTLGLIATNTIAQGDTRSTGLRWICTHGGTIYEARRRLKWPGTANVVVSVVHVKKGSVSGPVTLDGAPVPQITAFLCHTGGNADPFILKRNAQIAYIGTNVVGEGFKFDDSNKKGETYRLADMNQVVARNPRSAERLFPFLGGEEINDSPTHSSHRYIIDFGDMSEAEAREWPELMALVEERVKPKRMLEKREAYRRYWWRHGERRVELYRSLPDFSHVLVCSQTSKYRAMARTHARLVFSTKAIVFLGSSASLFSVLQTTVHEVWALFFGSTMKDDPVYTPSDCFETFPFPPPGDPRTLATCHPALEDIGRRYYDFRAALMVKNDEGLTKTYNRFHSPQETSSEIATLRALHAEMDRAVLDAYGFTDLHPAYDFRPQRDDSLRYTWDDATRDAVLGKLLDLNRAYAAQETAAAEQAAEQAAWEKAHKKRRAPEGAEAPSPTLALSKKGRKKGGSGGQGSLFD